jgi:zinc transport system substrate-binding protein
MGTALAAGACAGSGEPTRTEVGVATAAYPAAFLAERIGGERVQVTDLAPVGAEPHDLELTPAQAEELLVADLAVVIGGGFQPAVEDAADQRDEPVVILLDALSSAVRDGDPHVWLDPVLMARLTGVVEDALGAADPDGQAAYRRHAKALRADLTRLDEAYRSGLADCERRLLVTSHEAFGYLAARYGLEEEGVAGLSPDAEPDARRLAELADLARREGITTIFTEEQVSPELAETLAREAGGLRTEVLSPLETLTDEERDDGDDYLAVMERNLARLRRALGCS